MNHKKLSVLVVILWAVLTVFVWFAPAKDISESERRPLAQMPPITVENLLNGRFMKDFGSYSLDQFPLRDTFRQMKSLFHYNVLQQADNNGIYIAHGNAVKQEYPLNQESIDHALNRFQHVYDKYLAESDGNIVFSIIPDKNFYLAESTGHLSMDYEDMFRQFREGMPWAQFVDITDCLDAEDYYRTDTHWRQEKLLDAAGKLCEALGVNGPKLTDFTIKPLERPFYGVYYGQAALPMKPETLYLLESDLLSGCRVYDYETGTYSDIYNMEKRTSRDLYDVFLSGAKSLLTIENPNAKTDRELIIFRDSFGSSIAPLLICDYARVTLVDIRYIQTDVLARFLEFRGQDVLFLYSTLVLNNSSTIK